LAEILIKNELLKRKGLRPRISGYATGSRPGIHVGIIRKSRSVTKSWW